MDQRQRQPGRLCGEDQCGLPDLLERLHPYAVPGAMFYTLGSATLVLIRLQLITGILLALLYVPSVTEAWASLHYLTQHDAFGSIVRGIHLWSAYILLFVIGLHMVRTFFSGSYKRPRELNWVTGVGLFVLVLAMAITGAFLPWDQAAYWTAVVVTNIPVYTPFIGSFLRALWRGADTVGPTTLSRTFGIHVWLIPAILFPLILAHLALLRKHGEFGSYVNYRGAFRSREGVDVPPAPKQRPIEPHYPAVPTDELWAAPLETEDFYPHQIYQVGCVSSSLSYLYFILAVAIGAPLEAIADSATNSYTPGPEWLFLPLDELLLVVPQQLIPLVLVLPTGGVLLLLALPFIDRDPERNPFERPAVMVPGAFAGLFVVILTLLGSGRLFNP